MVRRIGSIQLSEVIAGNYARQIQERDANKMCRMLFDTPT